ncbi:hypothetical protein [Mesorhizobium sp. Root102]|uniref:hypothetical protein n=1 Tax=Mesorhizobium sp. Root102 TaxID=1736422 RepID=UPI000A61E2CA|nr:hypothetical protein [Mesorhizobium sp. Root102]
MTIVLPVPLSPQIATEGMRAETVTSSLSAEWQAALTRESLNDRHAKQPTRAYRNFIAMPLVCKRFLT